MSSQPPNEHKAVPHAGRPRGDAWRALQAEGIEWEAQVILGTEEHPLSARLIITTQRLAFARGGDVVLDVERSWLKRPPFLNGNGAVNLRIETPSGHRDRIQFIAREGRHVATDMVTLLTYGKLDEPSAPVEPEFTSIPERKSTRYQRDVPPEPVPDVATPYTLSEDHTYSSDVIDATTLQILDTTDFPPLTEAASPSTHVGSLTGGGRSSGDPITISTLANQSHRAGAWSLNPIPYLAPKPDKLNKAGWAFRLSGLIVLIALAAAFGSDRLPNAPDFSNPGTSVNAPGNETATPVSLAQAIPTATLPISDGVNDPTRAAAETAIALGVGGETVVASAFPPTATRTVATATASATNTPVDPTATRTVEVIIRGGDDPTETASPEPSATDIPTETPIDTETVPPTETATLEPTIAPTNTETIEPTVAPTEAPIEATSAPTETATAEPTVALTETPTLEPTALPTETPVEATATETVSVEPTLTATEIVTESPGTATATVAPTESPVETATEMPAVTATADATEEPAPSTTPEPTEPAATEPAATETPEPTPTPGFPLQDRTVDERGDPDQVFATGAFRYTVEYAQRAAEITTLELPVVAEGEWVVVVVHAENWSDEPATLNMADFQLLVSGNFGWQFVGMDARSPDIGRFLGFDPILQPSELSSIKDGEGIRLALVFLVPPATTGMELIDDTSGLNLGVSLAMGGDVTALGSAPVRPDLIEAVVTEIIDGRTIVVEADGQSATIQYLGINVPTGAQCYTGDSTQTNSNIVLGETVYLEREYRNRVTSAGETLARDVWIDNQQAGLVLVAAWMASEGAAVAAPANQDTRFAGWIEAAAGSAADNLLGFWATCGGPPAELPVNAIDLGEEQAVIPLNPGPAFDQ